jgi:hypothetical protein
MYIIKCQKVERARERDLERARERARERDLERAREKNIRRDNVVLGPGVRRNFIAQLLQVLREEYVIKNQKNNLENTMLNIIVADHVADHVAIIIKVMMQLRCTRGLDGRHLILIKKSVQKNLKDKIILFH